MRSLGVLLVLCFVAIFPVQGQVPQIPPQAAPPAAMSRSVFLDAVESTGSSKTINHWRDISGAYSQTKTSSRELSITARNMSALPGEFEIEWYFFGKPASGSGRFLYDKGSKKLTLAPNASEKFAIDSKELSNHTTRGDYYYYYGYTYNSGDKADGWVIRAKVGEEVVRVKASNAVLEQLTANAEAFTKLTNTHK